MKNKKIQKLHAKMKKHVVWLPYIAGLFFIILLGLALYQLSHTSKELIDVLIAKDVQDIHEILKKIDTDCTIVGFERPVTHIDFLTVRSFVGSQVGSMNLMYPSNWQGPYKDRTPTIQEQQYEIVQAKDGIFIVPGKGVKLANKKIIGKDIILNQNTEIKPLLQSKNALFSPAGQLGVQLKLKKHPVKHLMHASSVKVSVGKGL